MSRPIYGRWAKEIRGDTWPDTPVPTSPSVPTGEAFAESVRYELPPRVGFVPCCTTPPRYAIRRTFPDDD
jgi:hypothetical protein